MLAIENVLSPSIRNLFSVFLKMNVGVTNGSSSLLLKMRAFHSFKKRLSENILLPRVGGRQHQTARQLWKRNEAWKQNKCRNRLLRFSTQDRSIPRGPSTEGQLRPSGRLGNGPAPPDYSTVLHSRAVCGCVPWHCKYDPWQTQAAWTG